MKRAIVYNNPDDVLSVGILSAAALAAPRQGKGLTDDPKVVRQTPW